MENDRLNLFLSAAQIDALNKTLADQITRDYTELRASPNNFLVVVTLKGAMFFAADLIRKIPLAMKIDFVKVSSYGSATQSSGTVTMVKDLESAVEGQHVLVLDEIVDSGRTIAFLLARLAERAPKSIRVATLLSKPSRRELDVHIDYCGLEVEDRFFVGYGLDFDEKYRQLESIYSI